MASPQFIEDCMKWRGRVLTGKHAHWCPDWDDLPIDETCLEWPCACYEELTAGETKMDLKLFLERQKTWSAMTFGPMGNRDDGVYYGRGCVDHIKKELNEIDGCHGKDVFEWIDVIILALDGAMRSGYTPEEIMSALERKAEINRNRQWPDWRTAEPGTVIEHIK